MEIVFFDLETTGTSTTHDRIIQIALRKVKIDRLATGQTSVAQIDKLESLVNPFRSDFINADREPITSLNPIVSELTGIKDNDLKTAPFLTQIAGSIESFIGDCSLAGYNIDNFDFPILIREMERAGIVKTWKNPTIDVFVLYRKLYPNNLSAVYERLFGRKFSNAHTAMADVDATVEIFQKIFPSSLQIEDPKKLMEAISGKRSDIDRKFSYNEKQNDWVFMFGKHRGDFLSKNVEYLKWMVEPDRDFHESTKAFVRSYRLIYDKKEKQKQKGEQVVNHPPFQQRFHMP
jgi:DNA polymerase-3 subunit epsilon